MEYYMKSTLGKVALAAAAFGAAGAASAFTISGDAGVARSFKKFEPKVKGADKVGMKSFDYTLSAGVQPVDEIPVSVGLKAELITIGKKDASNMLGFQEKAKTAYGYQFSPEIKAWAPAELLGSVGDIVSPYAKVGYTFDALSNYRLEAKNEQGTTVKYDGEVNAYYIGIGTAVSVTENISALVDYTYSDGNVQFKNTTTKIKSKKDYLTTHSFMIGARISV